MKNKISTKAIVAIVGALVAGISAFSTELENKKQCYKIDEMENRLSELENKKES